MKPLLATALLAALVSTACAAPAADEAPARTGVMPADTPPSMTAAASAASAPHAIAPAAAASGVPERVYDGYDDFYATLPSPLFSVQDLRKLARAGLGEPAGNFWKWTAGGKPHVLELRDADVLIDGRRLPAAKATRFQDEPAAPALGRSATVYANDSAVCVEGVPGSASGTAVRHVRVSLITQPYGAQARRFELPSLFASCLGLTREAEGGIGFFRARYRWSETTQEAQGLTLERWVLSGTRFAPLGQTRTATFVEPGNVYRFTLP